MNGEEVKERLKSWLKDRNNLILIGIIALAFIIRLYYFITTSGQTLWWDEAEYMATAKHWVFDVPYNVNEQRPPLFQLLAAIILKIGFGEMAAKFLLVVLPSTALILFVYLLGKELFGKKNALIAAAASAVIWTFVFWSARFQPDFLSVSLQLLSLMFFWKLFKTPKKSFAIYAGLFAALGFYFKISSLLVPLSVFIFVLYKDGFSFIKNKNYWVSAASFAIAMLPFAIWQFITFGNPFAFAPSYIGGTGIGQGWDFGWMALSFFIIFPKWLFFVLFVLGAAMAIFRIAISFDIILKNRERRLDAEVFSLIILTVLALFYIFYIRGIIEDRWLFLMVPFILFISSQGILFIGKKLEKYNKILPVLLIIVCLIVFAYFQMQHANSLINIKKDSYSQIKEASLFIKENTSPDESALSISYTQATTYSERQIYPYAHMTEENFTSLVEEKRPSYLMVSLIEPNHPQFMLQQFQTQEGYHVISMPYLNSTIVLNQNQVISLDLKQQVEKPNTLYTLVWPRDSLNGVFLYRIDYQ